MQLAHRRPCRGADRSDRSRGVVMIEAAMVTPLFFLLVFVIVEVGFAMNDNLAVAHATRAGSRVASASGDDVFADYGILQSIGRESAALDSDQIERIVIYRPSGPGEPPSDGCKGGTPASGTVDSSGPACNVYTAADLERPKSDFGCDPDKDLDEFWCPADRDATLEDGTDYVGVWMKVDHPYMTGFFGESVTFTDSSVIRLEPRTKT